MHTMGFAIGLLVSFPGAAGGADEGFPYAAQIIPDQAYVRSGPGPDFYPTAKLRKGQQVTVYQHDRDGYCAIRPPEGSFSWVAAEDVDLRGDSVGEVLEDRVPSRVGSRFSTIRDVVHIRLNRGERVRVIGERTLRGKKWFKVQPPSGEFRWIARQDLDAGHTTRSGADEQWSSRPAHQLSAPDATSAETDARQTAIVVDAREVVPTSGEQPRSTNRRRATDDPAEDAEPATTAKSPGPAADAPPAGLNPRGGSASSRAKRQPSQAREQQTTASSRKGGSARRPAPPLDTADNVDAPLADRLERELSIMLAEESTVWEFGELRRSAQALLDEAVSTSDRVRARRILGKIDRLEDIKQRRIAVASRLIDTPGPRASRDPMSELSRAAPGPAFDRPNRRPSPVSQEPVGAGRAEAGFAGIGTLRPVVSRRPNAPRYALVDQNGKVSSFVSPTGGLNLQPYVGRRIGVTGNRGFMPQYSRPHVTAQRVTDFGNTTRITGRGTDVSFR